MQKDNSRLNLVSEFEESKDSASEHPNPYSNDFMAIERSRMKKKRAKLQDSILLDRMKGDNSESSNKEKSNISSNLDSPFAKNQTMKDEGSVKIKNSVRNEKINHEEIYGRQHLYFILNFCRLSRSNECV